MRAEGCRPEDNHTCNAMCDHGMNAQWASSTGMHTPKAAGLVCCREHHTSHRSCGQGSLRGTTPSDYTHRANTSDMSMVSMSAAQMIWIVTRKLTPPQIGSGTRYEE